MKNLLFISLLAGSILLISVSLSGRAGAVNIFSDCGNGRVSGSQNPTVCQDTKNQEGNNGTNNPIVRIIKEAISILSLIIGIGAVIGIVVSGFRFITAGGDSNSITSARATLVYSLIGLLVAVLAQALVGFVLDNIK